METWEEDLKKLPRNITSEQAEAIRKIGGRRRHELRIIAAKQAVAADFSAWEMNSTHELDIDAVHYWRRRAYMAAIAAIGTPGSASGRSAPGLFSNSPNIDALVAAYQEVLGQHRHEPDAEKFKAADLGLWHDTDRPAHFVSAEKEGDTWYIQVFRNDEDTTLIGRVDCDAIDRRIAEHLLACAIRDRAKAVDAWIVSGCTGDMPPLPDAHACEAHAAMIAARQVRGQ